MVIEEFVKCAPRENSGSRSANRFDYQLSWAFCLMLDLERKGTDFLLILDYHDDVVVFDSESDPKSADFYQIKTSTSEKWTYAKLIYKTEGKLSILGKLHAHRLNFKDRVKSLNFVSNQTFSFPIGDLKTLKSFESAKISEICSDALAKVAESLKEEHGLDNLPVADIDFVFTTNGIAPKTHADTAQGALSQFLNDTYGNRAYFVSHAFRAIIDLIKRRNNFEGAITSVEDLLRTKAVAKSEFGNLVSKSARLGDDVTWARLERMLLEGNLGVGKIRKYQTLWRNREIELLEYSNTIIQESQKIADSVVTEIMEANEDSGILEILNLCCEEMPKRLATFPAPFSDEHIIGVTLTAIINYIR